METVTKSEMRIALKLLKDFSNDYNANNLSKEVNLTSMGVLKILKRLELKHILKSKKIGKAVFYKPDFSNDYTKLYFNFLLKKESEESSPRIKRWVNELKGLNKCAIIGVLFGSVVKKEDYNDVDLLVVLNQSQNKAVNKTVDDLNKINVKHIHLVKQSLSDFRLNLINNKAVIDAVKNSVVIFGYEQLIEVLSYVFNRQQN